MLVAVSTIYLDLKEDMFSSRSLAGCSQAQNQPTIPLESHLRNAPTFVSDDQVQRRLVVSGSGEVSLLLSPTQEIRQRCSVFLSRERNRGRWEAKPY
jgi:hypothetical protein